MRRNRNIAALADTGWPVFEITIPATARTSLCAHFSQRMVAMYAYRRDALRKSGRKISRKPVAAGVRGRFLSLKNPIRRTNAGDEIGLITSLYWRFFGSADAGTIATPTAAATKSKRVPNCSTTVGCLRLKPLAAAIASIWRRNPALVGSETNSSSSRSLHGEERLLRYLWGDGRKAKHASCTISSVTIS